MIKKIISILIILLCFSICGAKEFYWESPEPILNIDTRFPSAISPTRNNKSTASAVFWEEIDSAKNRLYISARTTIDGVKWNELRRFAGPITYSGEIPDVYSSAINNDGVIAVATLSGPNKISVYLSESDGKRFHEVLIPNQNLQLVAPRIYASSDGGFVLFASQGKDESFSLLYAKSKKGDDWTNFTIFEPSKSLINPFVPYLIQTAEGDMVVFQAQYSSTSRLSYQIYSTVSTDKLKTWSEPIVVTDQSSLPLTSSAKFSNYNNQRPYLLNISNEIYLTWERTYYNSENATIWFALLSPQGRLKNTPEQITSSGNANRPILFHFDEQVNLLWFDTRSGSEKIYLSTKKGSFWDEKTLSTSKESTSFAYPVISSGGNELSFIWQQKQSRGANDYRVMMLLSDHTVQPPKITPRSFTENKRYSSQKAIADVNVTDDSSGIAGYSWIWTQDFREEPPEEIINTPTETEVDGIAEKDGTWYFKARQMDFAGNWSKSTSVSYYRDTTPPLAPTILIPEIDENGLTVSNSFSVDWQSNIYDDDIDGYTWSLQFISQLPSGISETKLHPLTLSNEEVQKKIEDLIQNNNQTINTIAPPPRQNMGEDKTASYTNRRNGLYVFSVAAIDTVGNIGPPSTAILILNKYIPSTYITTVTTVPDELGVISMSILGGGYTYDGTITNIYIDKDGIAPYDMEFNLSSGQYKVNSDNRISELKLKDIEEGTYRIGLVHSDRGLYFSRKILTITETGTVKIQNTYDYEPSWKPVLTSYKFHINVGTILLWTAFVLILLGLIIVIRGIMNTAREVTVVNKEIKALLTGDIMPQEKKVKSQALKQKGISLRVKLAGFTIALVVAIVALVSIPLGYIMTRTQEETLSAGLNDRVNVLLDSLATGAKAYLPTSDILQLSYLPGQTEALPEAKFATITGLSSQENNINLNYIWATNDEQINQKIDTEILNFGISRLTSDEVSEITEKCVALDKEAIKQAGEIAQNISELNEEGRSLALKTDDVSIKRRDEISSITTQLNTRLSNTLNTLSSSSAGSYPSYDRTKVNRDNTDFLFYKPVLYRQGSEQSYVRGIIFIEISTLSLIESVDKSRNTIIFTALGIAFLAIIIGFIGSFIVAAVIIKPIRRLASHVAMIRDTDDKETLADKDIIITSHDEIGVLGETVNEMTHGLAEAAAVTKNLIVGKDIQTKFIPLQMDDHGNTLTTGHLDTKGADFFSYYAGADELSGDYFDYKQIDENHYAVIKCDVSGHGVPAALIMVEVATLFLNYFTNWNMKNPTQGINLAPVVGKINDLLESRGFKGRFAAFTLCILNTKTGEVWFCNAGDNIVQIYDGVEHRKKIVTLQETPAAGMFSTDLIEMKGGYQVAKLTLKKNDVLFLYTDGIEEAKRNFRDYSYKVIPCAEQGLKEGETHFNHNVGETSEEMSPERVTEIIESVYNKKIYILKKYHNPVPEEELVFDFTTCNESAEDAIMALVSVEKIFRIYKPSQVKSSDEVRVDRKIDEFLRAHFKQYSIYCGTHNEKDKNSPYLFYSGVCEDPQYDDLTLVGIRKN